VNDDGRLFHLGVLWGTVFGGFFAFCWGYAVARNDHRRIHESH
jgi:hypothetical protein